MQPMSDLARTLVRAAHYADSAFTTGSLSNARAAVTEARVRQRIRAALREPSTFGRDALAPIRH